MKKTLPLLFVLFGFATLSTGGPCTDGYVACIRGGGTVDACWAGLEACLDAARDREDGLSESW